MEERRFARAEGAISATDSPGKSWRLGALQDLDGRFAPPFGARLVEVRCSAGGSSFITQRLYRIELAARQDG